MAPLDVPPRPRPVPLTVAAVVVGVEVLALVTWASSLVVDAASDRAWNVGQSVAIAVFALVIAALLAGAARALWHLRRWSRGLLVTWHVLQAAVGITVIGSTPTIGVPLLALALVVLLGVLAPSSTRALTSASNPGPAEPPPGADRASRPQHERRDAGSALRDR